MHNKLIANNTEMLGQLYDTVLVHDCLRVRKAVAHGRTLPRLAAGTLARRSRPGSAYLGLLQVLLLVDLAQAQLALLLVERDPLLELEGVLFRLDLALDVIKRLRVQY